MPSEVHATLLRVARVAAPRECCGLLAGTRLGECVAAFPVSNVHGSADRFHMDDRDQMRARDEIAQANLKVVGVYHSHPDGAAYPSSRDVEMWFTPRLACVIVSPARDHVRAFLVDPAATPRVRELAIHISPDV